MTQGSPGRHVREARIFQVARLKERYGAFLVRVAQTQRVWVLLSPRGKGAVVDSVHAAEPTDVEVVFSSEVNARAAANGNPGWRDWKPTELSLSVYLGVLPQLPHGVVAPELTFDGGALEVLAVDLADALAAATSGQAPNLRSVTDRAEAVDQFQASLSARFPLSSSDSRLRLEVGAFSRAGTLSEEEVYAHARLIVFSSTGELVEAVEQEVFVELANSLLEAPLEEAVEAFVQGVSARLNTRPASRRPCDFFPAYN